MVKRSLGKMSKRTRKLGASAKKLTPARLVAQYAVGTMVAITPNPRYNGMPHPRYRGKTGEIIKKRGKSYEVKIQDQNATKILIASGMHLECISSPRLK
ncbi:MAG: 50S ribosomal protein L21e [Candidatus Micrarchaeota archaeon]